MRGQLWAIKPRKLSMEEFLRLLQKNGNVVYDINKLGQKVLVGK